MKMQLRNEANRDSSQHPTYGYASETAVYKKKLFMNTGNKVKQMHY